MQLYAYSLMNALCEWNSSSVLLHYLYPGIEHELMLKELTDLALEGHLKAPKCTEVSLKDYKEALSQAMKPYVNSKYIFVFHR